MLREVSVNSDRYTRAVRAFGRVVEVASPQEWTAQSPCEGWTARHVVGHVVAVQHSILATIDGRRAPMNPMKEPERHAGDDPAAAWRVASTAIEAALTDPDVLDRTVTTWRGEMTVDEMLRYNVGDTTVHTWDLASALRIDDTLEPDLVEAALEVYTPIADSMRGPNVFAEAVEVDRCADAQTRLLALVGRARTT